MDRRGVPPKDLKGFDPVHRGHHDVEKDRVGQKIGSNGYGRKAVISEPYFVSSKLEAGLIHVRKRFLVFDDENLLFRFHKSEG